MVNPMSFTPGKGVLRVGTIFGAPLALQGLNWLPLSQLLFWVFFTWRSKVLHTQWSGWYHLLLGGAKMVVTLGSEWCHNIAHVAVARSIGQPTDAIRIIFGMPVLLYDEPEHPSITPRQHILRSMGGPVCSGSLFLASKIFRWMTPSGSPAREVADAAVGMNAFIAFGSLVPVPVFDGGPILKWSLIARGCSSTDAKMILTRTNRVLGTGLIGAAVVFLRKRHRLLAVILSFLGILSLAAGFGKMDV